MISENATINNAQRQCQLDRTPDTCPICHTAGTPINLGVIAATEDWVDRVLRCPKDECQHVYIAQYRSMSRPNVGPIAYQLKGAIPVTPRGSELPPNVVRLSPEFAKIFQQAEIAEQWGLEQIAGVGYRKALEFLMKGYAISGHSGEAEKIKALPLMQCINLFVKDARIMEVSKRAVWLGNDETHYLRKWEDKDIKDLKALIHLTVLWIDMELTTQEILIGMPEGKP
jgi:hypothetical protein